MISVSSPAKNSCSLSFESILALTQLPTKPKPGADLFVNSHGKKGKSHRFSYVKYGQAQRQLPVPASSYKKRSDVKQPQCGACTLILGLALKIKYDKYNK